MADQIDILVSQIKDEFTTLKRCYDEAEAANHELIELLRQSLARNQELLDINQELLSVVYPPPTPTPTVVPAATQRRTNIRSIKTQAQPVICNRCGDWALGNSRNGTCGPNGCYNCPA